MPDITAWGASRARTIVATSKSARLDVGGRSWELAKHSVTATGQLMFVPPQEACDELAALGGRLPLPDVEAVLADVASVPQPDRVRGWVHLRGTVTVGHPSPRLRRFLGADPGQDVLTLTPRHILLDWRLRDVAAGVLKVRAEHYESTAPDALAGWESAWTAHLHHHHEELVAALGRELMPGLSPDARTVPLMADAAGLVLRGYANGEVQDVRIDFPRPARSGQDAIIALDAFVAEFERTRVD